MNQTTTADDTTYNLVSVLYHAMEGATTYEKYAHDAQNAGDRELAQYFQKAIEQTRSSVEQGKQLLKSRL